MKTKVQDRVLLRQHVHPKRQVRRLHRLRRRVKDTSNPPKLQAAYDGGDGLHLNPTGYQKMADTVGRSMAVALFRKIAASVPTLLLCLVGYWAIGFIKPVRADQTGGPPISNNLGDPATAAELGVDIYPGAQQSIRAVRMKLTGQHFITVKFVTPDSREEVLAFYQRKLGPHQVTSFHMGNAIVSRGNNSSKDMVQVTIIPNSHIDNGKTQINVLHNMKD